MAIASSIRTGFADISPQQFPVALAGFAGAPPASGVTDPLEINLLWLGEGEDSFIVASVDALFAGARLRNAIAKAAGIRHFRVAVAASHTHYAPALEYSKPKLGAADEAYISRVCDITVDLVTKLKLQSPLPFQLASSSTDTKAGVYRRKYWRWPHLGTRQRPFIGSGICNAANPDVPISNRLRMAIVNKADSSAPSAILWSLSCHPSRFPEIGTISAEFIGHTRRILRAAHGAEVPILFFQGFSGDIAPRPEGVHDHISWRTFVFGPQSPPFSKPYWHTWCDSISDAAARLAGTKQEFLIPKSISFQTATEPLNSLLPHETSHEIEMQLLHIGTVQFLFVSAEVVGQYDHASPSGAWPIGCANETFGYWPTASQVREGGYEADGFLGPFGLKGPFAEDPELIFKMMLSRVQVPASCADTEQTES